MNHVLDCPRSNSNNINILSKHTSAPKLGAFNASACPCFTAAQVASLAPCFCAALGHFCKRAFKPPLFLSCHYSGEVGVQEVGLPPGFSR